MTRRSPLEALLRYERVPCVCEYLAAREAQQLDVESRFLRMLRLRNGVRRTTYRRRLDDTAILLAHHAMRLGLSKVRTLDVACSSGVSTAELHAILVAAGLEAETIGTDLFVRGTYVTSGDQGILFDSHGEILQLESDGFATPWYWRWRDMLCHPWLRARTHLRATRRAAAFRSAIAGQPSGTRLIDVPFLSSLVNVAGVSIVEEDLSAPVVDGQFEIIRAANILNREYFDDRQLARMIASLVARLANHGLFLVARSLEQTNHASLFAVKADRLVELEQINGGSEVRELVLGARRRVSAQSFSDAE